MTGFVAAAGWSRGRSETINADAFEFQRRVDLEVDQCRLDIAVADGASTTLYAGAWAAALVASAVQGWADLTDDLLFARIEELRRTFSPPVNTTDRFVMRKWMKLGSQATLMIASIDVSSSQVRLRVSAVGDTELVVIGSNECVFFPRQTSDAFDVSPALITSRQGESLDLQRWSRSLAVGEVVTLASDAVGKRLLELHERLGRDGIVEALGRLVIDGEEIDAALALDGKGPLDDDLTLVICAAAPHAGDDLEVLGALLRPTAREPASKDALLSNVVVRILRWLRRRF